MQYILHAECKFNCLLDTYSLNQMYNETQHITITDVTIHVVLDICLLCGSDVRLYGLYAMSRYMFCMGCARILTLFCV